MTKRILIVDDEPGVIHFAQEKLSSAGYLVETARNGREAWNIIKARHVDLIVTDVVMPVMDGVDLYKEIKKDPALAAIPIVIITDNRIFKESFQALGVEHFLSKPLDADKLLHKVEYVFTCAVLDRRNKQVLILGTDSVVNAAMAKILESKGLVVGKSSDSIDFFNNCLILTPRVVFVDVLVGGDIPARDVIRGFSCFSRLNDVLPILFTQFAPEDIGSMDGIEQLRQAKDDCINAGATKYIGRFTPATFWDSVQEHFH